jgi:hypothetical protein
MKGNAKHKKAVEFAQSRAKTAKHWIELHNALFGIGGKISELFPTETERTAFGASDEFKKVTKLIDSLRDSADTADLAANANGKLLIRVPRSIHAALLAEAEAEGTSVNQLVLAKIAMQLGALVRS